MHPTRVPRLRPLLRGALVALVTLSLTGCQNLGSLGGSGGRLQHILESKQLLVGLSGNQPPLNMRNKSGEMIGLEVDVIDALAESMGLEATLVTMPFADLLPALERGEVDLVISGLTITPERNARVAFAGPYLVSGKSVLTKSDKIASAQTPEALDDGNLTYIALAGSTSADLVSKSMPHSKLVTASDYDAAVKAVLDDEADALVADFPICALSVLRHPDAGLSTLVTPFTVEPLGIALPSDDPLLINLVQNYLVTLETTGLLTQLKARWLNHGAWVAELP
jgi:polar amino acid transport system substrate-binding protein